MKNEFVLAFNEVLEEKQLPKEIILQALESAMVHAYRKAVNASNAQLIESKIDPETGKVTIFAEKEVVESVQDERTEVSLEEARKTRPDAELGMTIVVESTPADFGRVAAQTARQVIQQRIRDAERQAQINYYEKQLGEIVSGIVQAVNSQGLTIGLEMRAEGFMARKDMIPGERFHVHDRVRALVAEVKDTPRGPQIVLSRTHRDFLRRLLENEVPEIYHGIVEIRSIAREPGERAKVAVSTSQTGIDPVGACVGIRGVRIQAIVHELHSEKIDVIEWNPDAAVFIMKAISPARVTGVYLNEKAPGGKTATVVVPEDQLSLAIGRDGQNARLAAKLTNWRIDIKSLSEAASDALRKLQQEPAMKDIIQISDENIADIENMLAKKAEGRPLTPEEYDSIAKFVDRIEKRTLMQMEPQKDQLSPEHKELRDTIPAEAFELNILDSSLPEHVAYILQEAGFASVGDLLMKMKSDPDAVFRLQGIGPKAMTEIKRLVEFYEALKTVPEAQPPAPVEEEAETLPAAEAAPVETGAVLETAQPASEAALEVDEEQPATDTGEEAAAEPVSGIEEIPEPSFDELFNLKPEIMISDDFEEEEEEDSSKVKSGKQKKKKKQKEVTYDPERDLLIVRKKHKRSDGWDWEE
ncbi:MAG: transcription termination/antitermination protein NusA [Anaerolineae bacterium]|nr:transcription termination/antitermination protein NusA [Anaerolineae bacterium]